MRKPDNNRVVVVGMEVSTSLGHGLEKSWREALEGKSGVGWLTRFDAGDYAAKAVGEIPTSIRSRTISSPNATCTCGTPPSSP